VFLFFAHWPNSACGGMIYSIFYPFVVDPFIWSNLFKSTLLFGRPFCSRPFCSRPLYLVYPFLFDPFQSTHLQSTLFSRPFGMEPIPHEFRLDNFYINLARVNILNNLTNYPSEREIIIDSFICILEHKRNKNTNTIYI